MGKGGNIYVKGGILHIQESQSWARVNFLIHHNGREPVVCCQTTPVHGREEGGGGGLAEIANNPLKTLSWERSDAEIMTRAQL